MELLYHIGGCLFGLGVVAIITLLPITLCLARRRRRWFLIEPGTFNPYKLVHKFARQHKTPVNRSAFTYCEVEVPTGLDLAKDKYGGPFTTEQVEDVKVFYGILKILFIFGAVFFLDFAASSVLPMYALHVHNILNTEATHVLLDGGLLSPLLIVICIPLYLCFLRPFILRYIPGMLMRKGLGIIFVLISLIASFSMDTAAHRDYDNGDNVTRYYDGCMFDYYDYPYSESPVSQSPFHLILQLTLSALSHMLIYTAVFDFICSHMQSPHSMKGVLI